MKSQRLYQVRFSINLAGSVNVIPVKKDIGCLITIEDIKALDLSQIKETVFFPGRAFVHDPEIKKILSERWERQVSTKRAGYAHR